MDLTQLLGLVAALFTTIANLPQAYKIIKTRSTKDVSTLTYVLLFTGLVLWIVYGILRSDFPLIIANSISALICATILFLKFTSKKTLNKLHQKTASKTSSK